jgi:hypothetical protein
MCLSGGTCLPTNCCEGECANHYSTNFIVFRLTLSGVEPTVYHTQGERANHYSTYCIVFGLTLSGVEPTVYHTQGEREL